MSTQYLERFYDDSKCYYLLVYDSAPVLPDLDEGSGFLTHESHQSTYSEQPRTNKRKRVTFFDDFVVIVFTYKFVYPTVQDGSVEWKDRGQTSYYIVSVWQNSIRGSADTRCVAHMDFCFCLGQDWSWNSFGLLNIDLVCYRK